VDGSIQQNSPVKYRALITGVNGQDGFYLAEWLLRKGYEVHGTVRSPSKIPLELKERLAGISVINLIKPQLLADVVRQVRPYEIYHLAAHHFSSQGSENYTSQLDPFVSVNLLAADAALKVLRYELPNSRFFYAASAHIFGRPEVCPQTETTPHWPDTLYAISKSAGVHLCRYYRESHGIYTSVGILYNHESPRRPVSFVTTQIARAAAQAFLGKPKPLAIRNLDAIVDWGAAQDYVKAMWLTLRQPFGDEYIIASGISRTVQDFANEAFDYLGLRADVFVFQDQKTIRTESLPYVGDSSKIRRTCAWEPSVSFRDLVRSMVDVQLHSLRESAPA
jgi:GDPmannose 4,6-dehydratase